MQPTVHYQLTGVICQPNLTLKSSTSRALDLQVHFSVQIVMDSDPNDNYEDLYEEKDSSKHDRFVDRVLSLNKTQQLRKSSRTEPTLKVSEFDLVKSITGEKGSIELSELTKSLKNNRNRAKIFDKVQKVGKISQTLPKPFEKPQADRIRRTVAYEKARLELDRWDPIITSNRVSTNLSFPLETHLKVERKDEVKHFTDMFRIKSKLQEELEKNKPVEEYHIELEKKEEFPLTMKEMLARRRDAAKVRALQTYKEAKARRQGKIKSKKYHRVQKRARIKQALKEFELLQKTNPEEALKKLEEIERARVEERFSLRHKSTGQWAKNKQIRAKYDKESRQALAEQLRTSKDLTQKLKSNDSDSDEVEAEETIKIDEEGNPWVNGVKPHKEVIDFVSGYRKYWSEKNKTESEDKQDETPNQAIVNNINIEETPEKSNKRAKNQPQVTPKKTVKKVKKVKPAATSNWDVIVIENGNENVIGDMFDKLETKIQKKMLRNVKSMKKRLKTRGEKKKTKVEPEKPDLSLPLQKKVPVIDEELIVEDHVSKDLEKLKNILQAEPKKLPNIDPNKFLDVKTTNLATTIPDIFINEDEEEHVDQRDVISEAFEDDDIVHDFNKDKKDEVEKHKPKDIDLNLPGWGSWGGSGVKSNKRKKRRFIVKVPKEIPRRDDNKGSLIINEKGQAKIKEHQVNEVPFPFKTVKDFEASIRAPVGNTFVSEKAFRRLIQPSVTTKMGTVIEPMNKELLLNKDDV